MGTLSTAAYCTLLLLSVGCGGSRRAHPDDRDLQARIRIDEPSGLTPTNFVDRAGQPLALVVDDDEQELFLVAPLPSGLRIHQRLHVETTIPVEDLEAVCFDARAGKEWYYAFPSHRMEDDPGSLGTLRFRLEATESGTGLEAVSVASLSLAESIVRALDESQWIDVSSGAKGRRIEGRPWWKARDDETPFALEIEGALCVEDRLMLGLKVPVADQGGSPRAILLEYSLDEELESQVPRVHAVDFGTQASYGISALARDPATGDLFAALNPIGDADEVLDELEGSEFGHSRLFKLRWSSSELVVVGEPWEASRRGAKLEGLAVLEFGDRRELWLTYDGSESTLMRIDLADLRDH